MKRRIPLVPVFLFLGAVFLAAPVEVSAATRTWNGGAAADSSWVRAANWGGAAPNQTTDDVVFPSGVARWDPTVFANITTGSGGITFNSSGYTIKSSNGTYTLTIGNASGGGVTSSVAGSNAFDAPVVFSVVKTTNVSNSGGTVRYNGTVSGSGGINKRGPGTLILQGNNTYSGGTTIESGGGTVAIKTATAFGTGPITIQGGSIDNWAGGSLTLTNNNTQTWNGSFTFTGTGDLNMGTGAVTLGADVTVTVNAGTLTIDGPVGGNYKLTKAGAGTLILNGANTFTGGLEVTGGTVTLGNASAAGTGSVTLGDSTTLSVTSSNLTVSGDIVSNGASNITFPSGTLSISGNLGLGNSSPGINANGGTIDFTGSGTQTITFGDTMTASLNNIVHSGSGSLTFGTGSEYLEFSDITNSSGILDFAGYPVYASSLTNNATLKLTGGDIASLPVPTLGASSLVQFYGTSGPYNLPDWPYVNLELASASATTYDLSADTDVTGDLTINANNILSATLANNYNLNVGGNWINNGNYLAYNNTTTFNGTTAMSGSSGESFYNLTISGSLTFPAAEVNITGNWTNSGAFAANGGTINFAGAAQTISGSGSGSFYDLKISNTASSPSDAATTTPSVAITVDNLLTVATGEFRPMTGSNFKDITIDAGGILKPNASATINLSGNFTNNGTFTRNSDLINFNGTTVLDGSGIFDLHQIIIAEGASLTPNVDIYLRNTFTNNGTFNHNNRTTNISGAGVVVGGSQSTTFYNISINDGGTLTVSASPTMKIAGNLRVRSGGTFTSGNSSTVNFVGPDGSITNDKTVPVSFNNLGIEVGAVLTAPTVNDVIEVKGNFNNYGTFAPNTSTVSFKCGKNQSITQPVGTETTFHHLTINTCSDSAYKVSFPSSKIKIAGNFTNSGTFNNGGGSVDFNGNTALSGTFDGTENNRFNTIYITGTLTAPSGTMNIVNDLVNTGTFNHNNGTVAFVGTSGNADTDAANFYHLITPSGTNFNLTGNIGVAGNFTNSGGGFTPNTYKVTFNGSGAQAITGATSFYDLEIANTAGSPDDSTDVNPTASTTVTNLLTVSDGQFQPKTGSNFKNISISAGGILKPESGASINISGDFTNAGTTGNAGTFSGNSGMVIFGGANSQFTNTADNAVNFNNLTIASDASLTAADGNTRLGVSGDWVNDGTFGPGTNSIITFNGTSAISGAGTHTFKNITLSNGTLTAPAGDLTLGADFTNNGGTFDANDGTIIFTGGSGDIAGTTESVFNNLTVNPGATLRMNRSFSLTGDFANQGTFTYNNAFYSHENTVTFSGTNQNISGSTTFYNLIKTTAVADTLTFEAGETQTISNDLTLQGVSGGLLALRSSVSGTPWEIDPQGGIDLSYIDVKDSNNISGTNIDCTGKHCTDSTGNTNWTFDPPPVIGTVVQAVRSSSGNLVRSVNQVLKLDTVFNLASLQAVSNQVSDLINRVVDPIIPDFLKPESPVIEPSPVPVVIPQDAPLALKSKWVLLPEPEIRTFVLAPLPKEFKALTVKFKELSKTFTEVGLNKARDLPQLTNVNIDLPTLAQATDLPIGVTIDELSREAKTKIPQNYVFARGGAGIIDLPKVLALNKQGEPTQTMNYVVGAPMTLVIKPDQPARLVQGYIVFKERKMVKNYEPEKSNWTKMAASPIFALSNLGQKVVDPSEIEGRLVLDRFEYDDYDNDGVYTATINAPVVAGEYEIITTIDYENPSLTPKETKFITVIDPEGYVFEKYGDKEIRIPDAKVTLLWLNPKTGAYENWPAADYQQKNPQVTLQSGSYSFLVPEGTYMLQVEARGYRTYRGESFKVEIGNGVHVNVELKPTWWWMKWLNWQSGMFVVVLALLLYNFYKDKVRDRKLKQS